MTFPNPDDEVHGNGLTSGLPAAGEPAIPQSDRSGSLPKLGSLASLSQTARMKHIKSAKTVLYVVGILTMGVSAVLFVIAPERVQSQIDTELRELGPDFVVDHAKMAVLKEDAVARERFGAGLAFAEGVVFLLLGIFVHRAPVAMTATGLILYGADFAIGAALDPTYLVKGIIVKIIIVTCLVKALRAAIAYERERKSVAAAV